MIAAGILVASVLLGLASRRLISFRLNQRQASAPWTSGELFLSGLRRVAVTWWVLAGLYGAALALPLHEGPQGTLHSLLLSLAILAGTIAGAQTAGWFAGRYAARNERLPGATSIFANIVKVLIVALGILVTLGTLGVSITPILGALGVGGLAVALALQDTLSNLFAGLHIIGSKKVLPGDYVMLDTGEEGYVEDVNWRNTSVRQLANNVVIIPNSRLASAVLTNYYKPVPEMFFIIQVRVSYRSDLEHVEEVTKQVGAEVQNEVMGAVPGFEPLLRFHTFNDFSIDMSVILKIREHTSQFGVRHEFVKRLHRRYAEEGIEIPFPIRTVQLTKPSNADEQGVTEDEGSRSSSSEIDDSDHQLLSFTRPRVRGRSGRRRRG